MTAETDKEFVERISREVYPGFDGWRTVSMMDHSLDRLFALALRGAETQEEDKTIEAELWGGDQANTAHEERSVREIYRQRLEIDRLRTALATARNDALEEAAKRVRMFSDGGKFADARDTELCEHLAAAIEALITKPTIEGE